MNDQAIELISERVVEALRANLGAIVADLPTPPKQLTVGQVAERLGVTRFTVYAHWREWGGYKLGSGSRAAIRFDSEALPTAARRAPDARRTTTEESDAKKQQRRTRRRDLLVDAPRFTHPLDGIV